MTNSSALALASGYCVSKRTNCLIAATSWIDAEQTSLPQWLIRLEHQLHRASSFLEPSQHDQSRKFADKGAAIANETLQKGKAAVDQSVQAFEQTYLAMIEQMRDYNLKMIDIAQANPAGVFEFARQLSTAKSSSDLLNCGRHTPKSKRRCSTNRSRGLRRSDRNSLAKAPRRSSEASARLSRKPLDHSLARVVANRALARGFDQATDEMMRPFFYLPLMHSELLADQDRSVRLHEALAIRNH
jgi:Bacterial protein of unknown function (DUF924)